MFDIRARVCSSVINASNIWQICARGVVGCVENFIETSVYNPSDFNFNDLGVAILLRRVMNIKERGLPRGETEKVRRYVSLLVVSFASLRPHESIFPCQLESRSRPDDHAILNDQKKKKKHTRNRFLVKFYICHPLLPPFLICSQTTFVRWSIVVLSAGSDSHCWKDIENKWRAKSIVEEK